MPCAGLQGTQRGTLHVVLSVPGSNALKLGPAARALEKDAEAAVATFLFGSSAMDNLIPIDPRPTAKAVTATVRSIKDQLREAGKHAPFKKASGISQAGILKGGGVCHLVLHSLN